MTTHYNERLKAHLADYKRRVLGMKEDGIWSRNGKTYSFPHILPKRLKYENLLAPYRDELEAYLKAPGRGIELHRDFHHLNSSQAMCFNLFYPLMTDKAGAEVARDLFELRSSPSAGCWCFEKIAWPEEGTNLDFFIATDEGAWRLFEIKLSENEFGKARNDPRHNKKLLGLYEPRLRDRLVPDALAPAEFFARYQLNRNLANLRDERDCLFLIYPAANVGLQPRVGEFLATIRDPYRKRVRVMHMECLVGNILDGLPHGASRLRDQLESFREKYVLN